MANNINTNLRKIFNYDNINESKIVNGLSDVNNLYDKTISACGCLFYKIHQNQLQLLLIKYVDINWPRLDDFGGRIDIDDNTLFDAMAREVSEETNNIINKDNLQNIISNNSLIHTFYNKTSKYYMKLINVNELFYKNTDIFGEYEDTDGIYRNIKWYNYSEIKEQLSFRLLNNIDLITYLDTFIVN